MSTSTNQNLKEQLLSLGSETNQMRIVVHPTGGAPGSTLEWYMEFALVQQDCDGFSDTELSQNLFKLEDRPTGVLLPTGTSVQEYVSGDWDPMYPTFEYNIVKGLIHNISPGLMFYYNTIEAPASGNIEAVQTNTADWLPFIVHQNQAYLYDTGFNIVAVGTAGQVGTEYRVTFDASGLNPGDTYYIGIKVKSPDLKGQSLPYNGATETEYFFSTEIDGIFQPGSDDSVTLLPKP